MYTEIPPIIKKKIEDNIDDIDAISNLLNSVHKNTVHTNDIVPIVNLINDKINDKNYILNCVNDSKIFIEDIETKNILELEITINKHTAYNLITDNIIKLENLDIQFQKILNLLCYTEIFKEDDVRVSILKNSAKLEKPSDEIFCLYQISHQ